MQQPEATRDAPLPFPSHALQYSSASTSFAFSSGTRYIHKSIEYYIKAMTNDGLELGVVNTQMLTSIFAARVH